MSKGGRMRRTRAISALLIKKLVPFVVDSQLCSNLPRQTLFFRSCNQIERMKETRATQHAPERYVRPFLLRITQKKNTTAPARELRLTGWSSQARSGPGQNRQLDYFVVRCKKKRKSTCCFNRLTNLSDRVEK